MIREVIQSYLLITSTLRPKSPNFTEFLDGMEEPMGLQQSTASSQREMHRQPPPKPSYLTPKGQEKSPASNSGSESEDLAADKSGFKVPAFLQWIPANWNWSKLKPVIRCAIAAWISAVLFVIPTVENVMGQVRVNPNAFDFDALTDFFFF